MNKHEISGDIWETIRKLRRNDICDLAPKFREEVKDMQGSWLSAGTLDVNGLLYRFDPVIFETSRSNELQQIYYTQRTTDARHAFYSWHFYGLAIDVISKSKNWDVPIEWWKKLGKIAHNHGLKWGGDWRRKDYPHIQWGNTKDTPDKAPFIYFNTKTIQNYNRIENEYEHQLGLMRVWKAVGAI